MCGKFSWKFDLQTSYKLSKYFLGLIFVVNIKFPLATYHTIMPSTEEHYCLSSGSACEPHLNARGDFPLVSSLVRFSRLTRLSLSEKRTAHIVQGVES